MDTRDILFLVAVLIVSTTLVLFIVQFVRSRGNDQGGNWWQGPWDRDDNKPDGS